MATMKEVLEDGIRLFNMQKYFEAHEALEAAWLRVEGEEKIFLHGLIQIAAAFHHYARGNPAGFRSLLEKGLKKLEIFGATKEGIDLAGLRKQLQPWRNLLGLNQGSGIVGLPPFPRLATTKVI